MKMFRKDEGFTLVELMVVVLIIGILVAIAVPVFSAAKSNAQTKSCFANQRTVESSYQTWQADNQDLDTPVTIADGAASTAKWDEVMGVLVSKYLKEEPKCKAAGTYTAAISNSGALAVVDCSIHHR